MAFNTKVDVADTELEADETVAAEAEDVTLEDEALVEAEPADDADEDDEEADESEDSLTYSNGVIEKIVAMATREVPHVLGMKGNLMHFVQEQFGAENLTKGVTVEVTDDNRVVVKLDHNTTEKGAYPIVLVSYDVACPAYKDANTAKFVKSWLTYVTSDEGQQTAASAAGSAPMSNTLRQKVVKSIDAIKTK